VPSHSPNTPASEQQTQGKSTWEAQNKIQKQYKKQNTKTNREKQHRRESHLMQSVELNVVHFVGGIHTGIVDDDIQLLFAQLRNNLMFRTTTRRAQESIPSRFHFV
jgi:hypothetical protein